MTYLFIALIILWAGILGYTAWIYREQKKVSRQLDDLEKGM